MVNKIFKYDFKKNFKCVWIFFVLSLSCAVLSRAFNELGKNIGFFNIVGIIFTSMEYAFMVNVIVQPLVRILTNFGKSMYGDESYLTHTLPATKTQILFAKYLSAIALMGIAFVSLLLSILILAFSKTNLQVLNTFVQNLFAGASVSTASVIVLVVLVLFSEFVSLLSIIKCAVVFANKHNSKKVLMGFVYTALFQFIQIIVSIVAICIVFAIAGDFSSLFSSRMVMTPSLFVWTSVVAIICYIACYVAFFFISRHELNNGVNVN